MKIELNFKNYNSISYLIEIIRQNKLDKLEIEIKNKADDLPRFSDVIFSIYSVLDYEKFFSILLKNFPYCVINEASRDHIYFEGDYKGEKKNKCKDCKYNNICGGFPLGYFQKYGDKEVFSIADIPFEVMLEVESNCNFNCNFCFNKTSFAKKNRKLKRFSKNHIKKIIKNISDIGVKNIRFTGGEPLLRKDILELIEYAKNKDLYVILNTNASLINGSLVEKISKIVDNILIPIEGWSDEEEFKITGYRNSLSKKIEAIKKLKQTGDPIIRVGTVATEEIVLKFKKMEQVMDSLSVDEWEFYRPISLTGENLLSQNLIKELVKNLINYNKKDKIAYIANSLPFCAIDRPNKINSVSKGSLFDEGHSRLVVDPRGFVKPHYFMDYDIGNPLDVLSAWNHSFMKKIRNLEFLPKDCENCVFSNKCCGGSRHMANLIYGDYRKPDPLANYKNKINK